MEDPAGDLPEDEVGVACDHGVPGVGAALVAHHHVGLSGQHVHQLALPFVAPLGADHNEAGEARTEHSGPHRFALPDDWGGRRAGNANSARAVPAATTFASTSSPTCCGEAWIPG